MIAHVDVLAVLREACDRDALPYEVHAAVAELIDALRNAPCYCEEGEGGDRDIVCDRCAALARIGGAQ